MIRSSTPQPQPPPPQLVGGSIRIVPSSFNAYRVAAVAARMAQYLDADGGSASSQSVPPKSEEFLNLCLSLARGIDYAVANNEVPPKAQELPPLLKRIFLHKADPIILAVVMVLMISVKHACERGWFSNNDSQELSSIADQIANSFRSPRDSNIGSTASLSVISTIMARFYPQLKMGHVLVTLDQKPGYCATVSDFHISKNVIHSPDEKIRLLVARTDNIETSACIISPPQVNFLLNGKAVEGRTNLFMDNGPQIPTNVTPILKYGTNLLQAVGQFNGHYIIAIAFMSMRSRPDSSVLKDYVPATVTAVDSDSDIIEGPSRISLNCPISRTRIKLPIKGHSCKHLQCFDYSNFVGINLRRPSWRCPHCNQYVCFTDIRVDQNILKILQEVGDDVSEVTVSVDGSWKALMESDDDMCKAPDESLNCHKEVPEQQKSTGAPDALPNILDLTGDDDEMDGVFTSEPEDRKPWQSDLLSRNIPANVILPSALNNRDAVGMPSALSGSDLIRSLQTPITSDIRPDTQMCARPSVSVPAIITAPSMINTTSLTATPEVLETQFLGNTNLRNSMMHSQFPTPCDLHTQPLPVVNSTASNQYGNMPSISRYATRTPTAIQALPSWAQTQNSLLQSRSMVNPMMPSGSSVVQQSVPSPASPLEGSRSAGVDIGRQQQFPRLNGNSPAILNVPSSSLRRTSSMQDRTVSPGQSVQTPSSRSSPGQYPGQPRASSGLFAGFQNAHLQQALNQMMPLPPTSRSPNTFGSPLPRNPSAVGTTSGPLRFRASAQQPARMPVQTPVQLHSIPSTTGPSLPDNLRSVAVDQRANNGLHTSSSGDVMELVSEHEWRPTRQMRGSLSGRAIADSLGHLVIRPTQQARATTPPSNLGSAVSGAPSQSQARPVNSVTHLGPAQISK